MGLIGSGLSSRAVPGLLNFATLQSAKGPEAFLVTEMDA